jgi:perosamine synthetase
MDAEARRMITPDLEQYEQAFAARLGVRRAVAFWRGRVAGYAVLKALGVGQDDEVIVPGYTCVMAINPVVYLGARPVFADIDPVTYNLLPDQVAAKITSRTKLIIAQHTYGYPAPMEDILGFARPRGIPVLEDCCLAMGSEYRGRLTGTLGSAAYFSFQWNKPYTSGLGGMAVTNDPDLARRLEAIRDESKIPTCREVWTLRFQLDCYRALVYPRSTAMAQGLFRFLARAGLVIGSSTRNEDSPVMSRDFLKRMSGMQARAGHRQLRRLDQNIAHRRRLAAIYDDLLRARGWFVPSPPPDTAPVLVRYPVRVAAKARALTEAARKFLELGSWFECPLHPAQTRMEVYGYHAGMCPEAERACREVVNLPVHPRANRRTARRLVEFLTQIGPATGSRRT